MADITPGRQTQRLDSWKAIAEYLSRNVRTVIRWEKERGLPVCRIPGGGKQGVFAVAEKLDTWLMSGGADRQEDCRLAIFPFVNESGSTELDSVCDGVTERLISHLAKVKGIGVLARSTIFRYRDGVGDLLACGRDLKVAMAVSGVVRRCAQQVVASVEVLDISQGTQRWGTQVSQSFEDCCSLEESLGRVIGADMERALVALMREGRRSR